MTLGVALYSGESRSPLVRLMSCRMVISDLLVTPCHSVMVCATFSSSVQMPIASPIAKSATLKLFVPEASRVRTNVRTAVREIGIANYFPLPEVGAGVGGTLRRSRSFFSRSRKSSRCGMVPRAGAAVVFEESATDSPRSRRLRNSISEKP